MTSISVISAIMRTVVLLVASILAACTRSQQTTSDRYWWLGLKKSPFGGRNYNLDEVSVTSSSEHSQQWHCTLSNESSFLLLLGAGVWGVKIQLGLEDQELICDTIFCALRRVVWATGWLNPYLTLISTGMGGQSFTSAIESQVLQNSASNWPKTSL